MSAVKNLSIFLLLISFHCIGYTQEASGYKQPPTVMADLLLAKPTPSVFIDSKGKWLIIAERNSYPTVEELGQPEMKIAGLRLNPNNFSPTRQNYFSNLVIKDITTGIEHNIPGLPANFMGSNISWNPAESQIAFLNITAGEVDLYVLDIQTMVLTRWNKQPVNNTIGNAYTWLSDGSILYKATVSPSANAPKRSITPAGPSIQETYGKAAPNPTFQDLIKSPFDEELFAFYCTSQLVQNSNGVENMIGSPGIYLSIILSPDREFLLQKILHKPFSYLVPAGGFASTVVITDKKGMRLKVLAELPSTEVQPSGYDNTQDVPRSFSWRDDEPSTITWCMPLDSGLIKKPVPFHDAVYALPAPFTGTPTLLFKTTMRYRETTWGDSSIALVEEGLQSAQKYRLSRYRKSADSLESLVDGNETDAYHNPGFPVTLKNKYGRQVLQVMGKGSKLLMNNTAGSTPAGDLPFLAEFNLATKRNKIIWRCQPGVYESVAAVIDPVKLIVLTRKESRTEPPNFFIKNVSQPGKEKQVTAFPDPYTGLKGVTMQKIFYKRADSISLTGNLYLPAGYDKNRDGPLPVLIWAYPREFNSAADAAQVRGSQYRFTTINWGSPVFFVTQGYAVLDNAEMPIVARNGNKPNDDFVEQLRLNAEAAINTLGTMGVGDPKRVAVGGHSYGAFMTVNLLAHTSLFKAGIARSGAYNRTLTPFGFQNEERTYWQAPKLYYEMSPFSYADKIKTPLLMIHGEADDNTGTFPINSERLFNAIKGNGGTARLVFLPYEAHGYRGKENLLHMLWEQNQWLDKYVKNAGK